jgi:hypothetical protein
VCTTQAYEINRGAGNGRDSILERQSCSLLKFHSRDSRHFVLDIHMTETQRLSYNSSVSMENKECQDLS